ncbi:MAG: hypothetical protein MUP66_00035 [Candidatus Nanohaloarchaeota archaeon QJJ-5]|nr:hypothetical protein [Candidatus Nanohaloarchaeota archaeon QJJ-5]
MATNPHDMYLDEMDRQDKVDFIKLGLLDGQQYDRETVADQLDVHADTASSYLADATEAIEDAGFAVDADRSGGRKTWRLDADPTDYRENIDALVEQFDYDLGLEEFSETQMPELQSADQQARYIADMVTGAREALHNNKYSDKDDDVNLLYLSEPGFGTKFHNEDAWDALLEEVEGEDLDGVVFNGDAVAWVPKRYYKTASQHQDALGYLEDEDGEDEFNSLLQTHYIEKLVDDELTAQYLPEDEEQRQAQLREIADNVDQKLDSPEGYRKITDINDSLEFTRRRIQELQDVTDEDVPLFFKFGEGMDQWVEDMVDYKVSELSDALEERMEGLEQKIETYYDVLDQVQDTASRDLSSMIGADPFGEDANPLDLDLDVEGVNLDDHIEDDYNKAIELQKDLTEMAEEMKQFIRSKELNLNAMLVERAIGEYAQVFGRSYLDRKERDMVKTLAELEVEEEIHSLGNVQALDDESGLMTIDVNGYEIDITHGHFASDEPLKYGLDRVMEEYKRRDKEPGDMLLAAHEGEYTIQPMNQGRSEIDDDPTYIVQGSTFMDKELLEEYGWDEGLNLNKDVKRLIKGLHDGTASMVNLSLEEAPDGELRKVIEAEGWGVSDLKDKGEQARGKTKPGRDTSFDPLHFVVRGDDHFGAPHYWKDLHEGLTDHLVEEDFTWIHDMLDRIEDGEIDGSVDDVVVMEMGDALHGYDNFDHQQIEGEQKLDHEMGELQSEIINVLEGDDVSFEDPMEVGQYLAENDVGAETQLALSYAQKYQNNADAMGKIEDQKDLVDETLVQEYERLLDRGVTVAVTSGNHGNNGTDTGHDEAREVKRWFDDEYEDQILVASGEKSGRDMFHLEDFDSDVVMKAQHGPRGNGKNASTKAVRDESLEDFAGYGHRHTPFFVKKESRQAASGGSSQSSNQFSKEIISPDESPQRGAMYVTRSKDSDDGRFKIRHVPVRGLVPAFTDEE